MVFLIISIIIILGFLMFFLIRRFGNNEKKLKNKLNVLLQTKQYIPAINLAQKIIKRKPHNPENYFTLADIYQKAKMINPAFEVYNDMIKSKIFSVSIKEHNIKEKLAYLNFQQNKIIESYKEAYAIYKTFPKSPETLGLLGQIYGSQRKYDKSKVFLKKAMDLNPKEAEYHTLMGLLYLDEGDLSLGYTELDQAYKLDPSNLKTLYFLALACKQKGLEEKAKTLFNKLNITNLQTLPETITQIGLMTQNIPRFEIEKLEAQIDEEFQKIKPDQKSCSSVDELLTASTELLHNTIYNIINKMGYSIKENVQNHLIDNSNEINVIATPKNDQNNSLAISSFIQFSRTKSDIGIIPYSNFISKMHELNIKNGIYIITSEFNANVIEKVKQEDAKITLIDANKLRKYF